MESDGAASSSRRSERSSSTQGVYAPRLGEQMDGVAPKCSCGAYAILYLSKTVNNPNRLFFGCPFFKGRLPHCRFFMWLDRYTAKLGNDASGKCAEEVEDVSDQFSRMQCEWRFSELEKRVACLEKKKNDLLYIVMGLLVVLVALYDVAFA
ncbi:hypothetical protein PIB30_063586 [Stylosanthes scabra]|uniref:GRF-type domain-containing protein n=1 Tax=Stylosanthes scabra TaxID=79078 RepID=A0ABU6QMJ9_9FABA|nr:hypothetical protein [Stylosanthes scabra]